MKNSIEITNENMPAACDRSAVKRSTRPKKAESDCCKQTTAVHLISDEVANSIAARSVGEESRNFVCRGYARDTVKERNAWARDHKISRRSINVKAGRENVDGFFGRSLLQLFDFERFPSTWRDRPEGQALEMKSCRLL